MRRHPAHPVLAVTAALSLAACGAGGNEAGPWEGPSSTAESTTAEQPSTSTGPVGGDVPRDLAIAVSDTREDSVYPDVGDPLVDALHYDLDLSWDPDAAHLEASETLTFRATADADSFRLDLADALEVSAVSVDGADAAHRQKPKDLVVGHAVTEGATYVVEIAYAGSPEPWSAPTDRPDFTGGVGWTTTDEGEAFTFQEPYGAFTWYAANDQPADKALYDFTLTVPAPWSGVANGELTSTTTEDGLRTTTWHLAEPAASYLTTVAFDDFAVTELESDSGVPITLWGPAEDPQAMGDTDYAPEAMAWLEEILGPYPFDTFGIVVVDGESGMETQTMVTLGDSAYATSKAVVVHELAHHWYGDTVTPSDWSDVWMNEGMTMYIQGMWEAEDEGIEVGELMDRWAEFETVERNHAGPPADYHPDRFGSGNIYYGPALMWHELRERIGDEAFFDVMRAWPESQENGSADRDEYLAWVEERTGEELTAFFDAWLLGAETPPRD